MPGKPFLVNVVIDEEYLSLTFVQHSVSPTHALAEVKAKVAQLRKTNNEIKVLRARPWKPAEEKPEERK